MGGRPTALKNMNSPDINGTQKVGTPENEALIKKLRARDKAAYFISYASVVLVLACGVCLFIGTDSFQLIRRFSETALGKSVAIDAFLLIFFIFGMPQWGILRFKAWACAGAAAYIAYSLPEFAQQAWAFCAASTLLGACTLRKGPVLSAFIGVAALLSCALFYKIY